LLAAFYLAGDGPGLRVLARRRRQHEMETRLAMRGEPLELIGIGIGKRRGGNLRYVRLIVGRAGMRDAVIVGAERAMEIGDRAALGGFRGTRAADRIGGAIAGAIHHARHTLGDDSDLAGERALRGGEEL